MRASAIAYAPAKLNLTLEVLGRRSAGFHGVRSVMVPIDLCDELEFSEAPEFQFECDVPELQRDNIVGRAVCELPQTLANMRVSLRKRIPTQAGLGGASSDAAAVLLAAQHGMFGPPPQLDYVAAARRLGSDVPFFLVQTAALVEGTGERVTALGALPAWHAIVVKPPLGVNTRLSAKGAGVLEILEPAVVS